MTELSRRFFLGGAMSLLAVTTSAMPKLIGNMPQIWGDGKRDDTDGIGALLRNKPVVFTPDKVTIESHQGITFHEGKFLVSRTIEIPAEVKLVVDRPTFRAFGLASDEPFFRVACWEQGGGFAPDAFAKVWFKSKFSDQPFIAFPEIDVDAEFEADWGLNGLVYDGGAIPEKAA